MLKRSETGSVYQCVIADFTWYIISHLLTTHTKVPYKQDHKPYSAQWFIIDNILSISYFFQLLFW
jgi:hypothetical protein